jgi:hypothetical protein
MDKFQQLDLISWNFSKRAPEYFPINADELGRSPAMSLGDVGMVWWDCIGFSDLLQVLTMDHCLVDV